MRPFSYVSAYVYRRRDRAKLPFIVRWRDPLHTSTRCQTRGFPTLALAKAWAREIEAQVNNPSRLRLTPLDQAFDEYDAAIVGVSASHLSEVSNTMALAHAIWRGMGKTSLQAITAADCDAFFAARRLGRRLRPKPGCKPRAKAYSVHQQRKEHTILHAIFELHLKRGAIAINPMRTLVKPVAPALPPRVPRESEWVALLEAVADPKLKLVDRQAWHLLILAAALTGLDRDELLALEYGPRLRLGGSDTNGVGIIEHRRRKSGRRGVPGRVNFVGFPAALSDRLAVRLALLPDGHSWIFPWQNFQRGDWRRICTAAKFSYPFKSLRRVAATEAARSAALDAAARRLGHSDRRITEGHYVGSEQLAVAIGAQVAVPAGLPALPPFVVPGNRVSERGQRLHRKKQSSPTAPAADSAGEPDASSSRT